MKIAGHTMGTPELNLHGAMKLFSKLGYDGIEIRCAKDGQIDTTTVDQEYLELVKKWQTEFGLEIVCLTSYFKDFVTRARAAEISKMKRVIEIASFLQCPFVRVYGGLDPVPDGYTVEQDWEMTASGIRELGEFAKPFGVKICIETHIGSLTLTAADTVKLVRMIDLDNVGILFDFAWIYFAEQETVTEAIDLCAPHIFHCHYKDWVLKKEGQTYSKKACLMGEGSIPWQAVFTELQKQGYSAYVSDEYEKYWYPDILPDPEIGMKKNLEYVRNLLG